VNVHRARARARDASFHTKRSLNLARSEGVNDFGKSLYIYKIVPNRDDKSTTVPLYVLVTVLTCGFRLTNKRITIIAFMLLSDDFAISLLNARHPSPTTTPLQHLYRLLRPICKILILSSKQASSTTTAPINKKFQCHRPGTVTLKQIKRYQMSTDLLLQRGPSPELYIAHSQCIYFKISPNRDLSTKSAKWLQTCLMRLLELNHKLSWRYKKQRKHIWAADTPYRRLEYCAWAPKCVADRKS